MCYCDHYVEVTSQHVDSFIANGMECVRVNIIWRLLQSTWTVLLRLDEVCYSEYYVECTAQQVDSGIAN